MSTVEMTCAITSLAPQLTGVMTGNPVSGGTIDTMSKLGPTFVDLEEIKLYLQLNSGWSSKVNVKCLLLLESIIKCFHSFSLKSTIKFIPF